MAGATLTTTLAAAALGGAVGSAASQGFAMAVGMQEDFSWKAVGLGALGSAVTAGVGAAAMDTTDVPIDPRDGMRAGPTTARALASGPQQFVGPAPERADLANFGNRFGLDVGRRDSLFYGQFVTSMQDAMVNAGGDILLAPVISIAAKGYQSLRPLIFSESNLLRSELNATLGAGLRSELPFGAQLEGLSPSATNRVGRFATTESVTISGSRAIDLGQSYEVGVRGLYGDIQFQQRQYTAVVNGQRVNGVADTVTSVAGRDTAVEAKFVENWSTSLRNPASANGAKPWAVSEQQTMVKQATKYSAGFDGGVIYHTNSAELAAHYSQVFRDAGVTNFRFVITPAKKF